jgi:membrane-bound lytic murein transglycosylase A
MQDMLFQRLRLSLLITPVLLGMLACSSTVHSPRQVAEGTVEYGELPDYSGSPAVPVTKNMQPGHYTDMPGWKTDDVSQVWPAFMASCTVLVRRAEWKPVCEEARSINAGDSAAVRHFFEQGFLPYKMVADDGNDRGLVTGYYEPLLQGSRKQHGVFQTALHSAPPDLVTLNPASAPPEAKGYLKTRRVGQKMLPYWTRAELFSSTLLRGREIVWVDDAVEAFFLQVQGSGRVYLAESNETIRLAYADHNGHSYKSIGRYLVDKGEMTLSQASAQSIKKWIKDNPARERELFNANPRYVFFREEKVTDPSIGPRGALNVPLTGERSIAIDPGMVPLGAPVFLATTQPNSNVPLQKLVMAQDTGYAIRGAVRADFFWGYGYEAGERAGSMKQQGEVWVLLPKAR